MTNSIRNEFRTDLAALISNEIQYQHANYYYFLGKIDQWSAGEIIPQVAQIDSVAENNLIRSNMLFMRRITPNEISLVAARYNWISGQVYDKWDHTKNMRSAPFFCQTDEFAVYKCLDNAGNKPSTEKPTGKSFYTFKTSDGYTWKYMYTIPTFKRTKFSSLTHIPVQKSLSDSFYNKGSIDAVVVSNSGDGYGDVQLTTITVSDTTTGSGAVGSVVINTFGQVTNVNISHGGTGYKQGVNVTVNSTTGNGCLLQAVVDINGIVIGVTISDGGQNYTGGDQLSFSLGGAIIVPFVSSITGGIEGVKILNAGIGYATNPILTVVCANGTGKYGNSTAVIQAIVANGVIARVNIIDPGIGYLKDSNTQIISQGDGVGAEFSPVVSNGKLVGIVVENSGAGYTNVKLTVVGTGSGAIIKPIITTSDFVSDQSIVEQTAVIGAIYSVAVDNGGTHYSENTTVTVTGDGTGCSASPVIVGGSISHIIIDSPGTNYTYANIAFNDPPRELIVNKISASVYAIFPPLGGHGNNAVVELYGDTIAIHTSLRQEEKLNNITQDYRQYGIVRNPTALVTNKLLLESSTLISYTVIFSNVVGLKLDEILISDSVKFRVVSIVGSVVILQKLGTQPTLPVGNLHIDNEPTRVYSSISITSFPTANKYSGSLMYISNESPFTFTPEQGIVIKTFLTF